MEIIQDITLPKKLDDDIIKELKAIASKVKERFEKIDFYDDVYNVLKNNKFTCQWESYVLIEIENQIARYITPDIFEEEPLTKEDLTDPPDHPPECYHLIHKDMKMDFSLIYLWDRAKDQAHFKLKENFADIIKEIEDQKLTKEAIIFHFSPEGILRTHTDGQNFDPNYSFIINISCEKDCGFFKVNDRIIDLGNKSGFIFDATNNPHALWNNSKDNNWLFIVLRLAPELFHS